MAITTLLSTLLISFANPPDLCDAVYTDALGVPYTDSTGQTLSRYCEWTGPDAPVWDDDVCCSIVDEVALCWPTSSGGGCPSGISKMYCEYGTRTLDGGVLCYQPFASACDAGWCVEAPEMPLPIPIDFYVLCCGSGGCQFVEPMTVGNCQGELLGCLYGISNSDGTVECLL